MKKLFILIMCLYALNISAQNSMRPNIYQKDLNFYNPAAKNNDAAGTHYLSLYGKHKFVNNDLWNKPMNILASYTGGLNNSGSFYTASYLYDGYSFYDRHSLSAGYTYQTAVSESRRLTFGARGILNYQKVDWDELGQVENKSSKSSYYTPDMDLGVQYRASKLTVGLSVKNIFENTSKVDGEALFKNQREIYSSVSYDVGIGQNLILAPYTLLRLERKLSFDIGASLTMKDHVYAAYHFRTAGARSVYTIGGNLSKKIHAGIAFDHSFTTKDKNLDFMVGYVF